jgi:hypothetical protein
MSPPLSDDELAQLQGVLGGAGLTYDPSIPTPSSAASPTSLPAPINVNFQASLPPDVAARTAAQNAIADSGPRTVAPPSLPYDKTVGMTPQPALASAAATQAIPQGTSTSSTSKTVQSGVPFSEETLADQANARQVGRDFQAEQAGATRELGAAQNYRQAATDAYANQAAQNADAAQAAQAASSAQLAPMAIEIRDAQDALAKKTIDPDRFFHNQNIFQSFATILAQAAGAFGAGLTHTPNYAAEMIQNGVDRDIDAQKANIAKGREDIQGKIGQYNLKAGALKSKDEADAAARAIKLSAVGEQIKQAAEATQDPLERMRLLQVGYANAQNQAKASAEADELAAGKTSTTTHSTYSSGGAAGGAQGALTADHLVRGPDGKMFMVGDPAAAKKLQESSAVATRLQRNIELAKSLRGMGQLPGTDASAKMGPVLADIKRDYLFLNGDKIRASGGNGNALIDQAVGDPSSMFDFHGGVRLDALAKGVNADLADNFSTAGAQPLAQDPTYAISGGKPVVTNTGIPTLPAAKGRK